MMAGDLAEGVSIDRVSSSGAPITPSLPSVMSLGKRLITQQSYSGLENLLREAGERTKGMNGGEWRDLVGGLLEEAAGVGSLDCMELLLQHVGYGGVGGRGGAKVMGSPLHRAARELQPDAVEILLLSGMVEPGAKDVWGKTPLHMALEGGRGGVEEGEEGEKREVIVAMLLYRHPGLIREVDRNGNEPLHIAAKRGLRGMVGFLMSKGAREGRENRESKKASECARAGGHKELERAMREGTVGFKGGGGGGNGGGGGEGDGRQQGDADMGEVL